MSGCVQGRRGPDAILIRNARVSWVPTRREGKARYIRLLAWSRYALGAAAAQRTRSARLAGRPRGHPHLVTHRPAGRPCCRPASRTPKPPERTAPGARERCHAERSDPMRCGPRPDPGRPLAGLSRGPPSPFRRWAARALRLGGVHPPAAPVHLRPPRPVQLFPAHPRGRHGGLRAGPERAQFGGNQGSRFAESGHQGCAQCPVPLYGRRRQDARAASVLARGLRF